MNIREVSPDYAVAGQITPEDVQDLAADGYKSIICARPDDEDPGQPAFASIEAAAKAAGLEVVHIPVSGPIGPEQVERFRQVWREIAKPAFGYCRSGGRAGNLYAAINA